MKSIRLLSLVIAASILCAFMWNTHSQKEHYVMSPLNAGGASPGKTGAPGEANCTQCHAGSVQDGTAENLLVISQGGNPVSSYTPGQQYNVNLSMMSNPVKRGFQATVLNSSNVMAGSFTGIAGNTSINGSSKKYANHTSTSNTSSAAPSWNWTWTAPAAGTGDVTFYVATNKTNNNGNDNGDIIYLSQWVLPEASNAGIPELPSGEMNIMAIQQDRIILNSIEGISRIYGVCIYDGTGKRISFNPEIKDEDGFFSIVRPAKMTQGIFFVTWQINQKIYAKKVLV